MSRSAYGLDSPRAETAWWNWAACLDWPSAWWTIEQGPQSEANRRALMVCRGCPVLAQCGEWADSQDWHGQIVAGIARRARR